MKYINVVSYRAAQYLAEQMNDNHEKRHVYYYGFQIIFGGVFKLGMLILITLLLKTFEPTFIILSFFAALRIFAGGYHMESYNKCMATSFSLFIILGFILKYTYIYWHPTLIVIIVGITFIITLYTVFKYAPTDTPYKPIKSAEQIMWLKVASIIMAILWMVLQIILLNKEKYYYSLAGCLGILMGSFIISPIGYKFFDRISGKYNTSGR